MVATKIYFDSIDTGETVPLVDCWESIDPQAFCEPRHEVRAAARTAFNCPTSDGP